MYKLIRDYIISIFTRMYSCLFQFEHEMAPDDKQVSLYLKAGRGETGNLFLELFSKFKYNFDHKS